MPQRSSQPFVRARELGTQTCAKAQDRPALEGGLDPGLRPALADAPQGGRELSRDKEHHESLLRSVEGGVKTRGLSAFNLDWADPSATILVCAECGRIEWFAHEPTEISNCDGIVGTRRIAAVSPHHAEATTFQRDVGYNRRPSRKHQPFRLYQLRDFSSSLKEVL